MFTAGSYGSIVLGSACIEATKAGASSSNLDFLQTKKKYLSFITITLTFCFCSHCAGSAAACVLQTPHR
jgi:hypothetical protein